MPKQDAAEPFGADELLFRRVIYDWVDGPKVLGEAIQVPRCSVDRESLAGTPEEVLARGKASETGVVAVRFSAIPDLYQSPVSDLVYESIVKHCPEAGNDAHSEIRVRHRDTEEPFHKPGSTVFREMIKDKIAEQMSVVIPPTPG
jgi:hypothetical protein